MPTIDERVVEMRFDNKQFENGVKESLGTLERLKMALNFSSSKNAFKDLDKVAKATSLDAIASGVDLLTKRFSVMGIVGMQVISNITTSIQGKLANAIAQIRSSIIGGGIQRAMNLEKAHFQLQSIIGDEARVQEVMNAANKSVDGTAYSFDVAAKAASQFYASGVTNMESMDEALRGLVGTTATFSADYGQMSMIWTQVAGQGRLMGDQLLQLSTRGANAAVTIADFMNGVNAGSIQASNSVTEAVRNVSKGTKNTEADIRDFVSKGKINFDIFAAAMNHAFGDSAQKANETFDGALSNIKSALARIGAGFISPLIAQNSKIVDLFNAVRLKINDVKSALVFDESIGNVHALSKQVTDFVLNTAGDLAEFVNNLDLTKPLRIFYYGLESIKNVGKGLLSILEPIGKAFANVFLSFTTDDVVNLARGIELLTSKFKLSDRSMYNLQTTFQGLFDVIQLIGQAIVGLIGIFVPLGKPMDSMAGGILEITGTLGRALTKFSIWVRQSPAIQRAFGGIRYGIQKVVDTFSKFFKLVNEIPLIPTFVNAARVAFDSLGKVSAPLIEKLNAKLLDLKAFVKDAFRELGVRVNNAGESFISFLQDLNTKFSEINFETVQKKFKGITDRIAAFTSVIFSAEGISVFIGNLKEFFRSLKEGFTETSIFEKVEKFFSLFDFSKLVDNLEKFKKVVGDFVKWVRTTIGPTFSDVSIGGLLAGGGGLAFIFAMANVAQSLRDVSKNVKEFPKKIFGDFTNVLKAYQNDLNASRLLKISAAIAILAGTIILLSFADFKRVIPAVLVLATIAGVFIYGSAKLLEAAKSGRAASNAVFQVGVGIKRALSKLAGAVRIKAIGSTMKDFGTSVAVISGSIIALAAMYKKDSSSVKAALNIVGVISAALVGVIGITALLGDKLGKGVKNFGKAASGVVLLSVSLALIVGSLKKLLEMDIPTDWKMKLGLMAGIFGGLALLVVSVGGASRLAGGKSFNATGTILSLSVMLIASVSALKKVFSLDFPEDWKKRLLVLSSMFATLAGLILVIGVAGKLSGGKLKAASSILAMCILISTMVGSLMILSLIPADRLTKGSTALGTVLLSLAGALAAAGAISQKDTYKSVLSMALVVASITAALGILSMVPVKGMIKAVTSLGIILAILAVDLAAAAKTKKGSYDSLVAMAATVVIIAGSLAILANQPWKGLLAAGVTMGATLLIFAKTMQVISKSTGLKKEKIHAFLEATLALVPIGVALYALSGRPWESLLASGVALTSVVIAFANAMKIISSTRGINAGKIGNFLLATVSLVPIGMTLYALASQPWQNILAAAAALSGTLLVYTGIFALISNIRPNVASIVTFGLATAAVGVIAYSIFKLAEQPWQNVLASAAAISAVLLSMTAAMAVCTAVGSLAGPAAIGILLLDAFIANFLLVLLGLGKIFEDPNLKTLLNGGADILAGIGDAIGRFVGGIVGGAIERISESFVSVGTNLSKFMTAAEPFFEKASNIDQASMNGVKYLAQAMLAMTAASVLDGLTSWFTGGSSFVSFGQELAAFGPYLNQYYNSIKNVDGSIVESSAAAAQVLADMASKLPNSGGLAAKIMGDNSLASFGRELVAFGPLLARYATQIAGVDGAVIEKSAAAAQVLADMASKLPNSGGLAAKIMGDNKLSDFGKELSLFGPYLSRYAISVASVNGDVVSKSVSAAQTLSAFAKELPNSGGLVALFTGDNTISGFGEQLVKFGTALSSYASSISSVDFSKITSSISSIRSFINVANQASGSDTAGINRIFESMKKLGTTGVTDLTKQFQNASPKVTASVNVLVSGALTAFDGKNASFTQKGALSAMSFVNGLKSKTALARSSGVSIIQAAVSGLSSKISEFTTKGKQAGQNFVNGLRSVSGSSAGKALASNAASGMSSGNFYSAGVNAAQGFINGIRSKEGSAWNAGSAIGDAAYRAAKKALKEHSPSKKMGEVGAFAGEGFVNSLMGYVEKASRAGSSVGNASFKAISNAVSDMSNVIDNGFDVNPVLTPTVNLENVNRSANEITRMFNNSVAVNASSAVSATEGISSLTNRSGRSYGLNGAAQKIENNYYLSQTNNSPKALSRMEIYRDTQNLLSTIKEVNR